MMFDLSVPGTVPGNKLLARPVVLWSWSLKCTNSQLKRSCLCVYSNIQHSRDSLGVNVNVNRVCV